MAALAVRAVVDEMLAPDESGYGPILNNHWKQTLGERLEAEVGLMRDVDSENLARCAVYLEQIANVLTLALTTPADQTCAHPDAEREVDPGSVMGNLTYRCKSCGDPCPEPGS